MPQPWDSRTDRAVFREPVLSWSTADIRICACMWYLFSQEVLFLVNVDVFVAAIVLSPQRGFLQQAVYEIFKFPLPLFQSFRNSEYPIELTYSHVFKSNRYRPFFPSCFLWPLSSPACSL